MLLKIAHWFEFCENYGNNKWPGPRIVTRNIGRLSLGTMEPIMFEFWNKVLKTELILNLFALFFVFSSILCFRLNCFKFCISINVSNSTAKQSLTKNYYNIVNHTDNVENPYKYFIIYTERFQVY